ncbi:MAG: tyrosine-type recombinase/integrase [Salinarimonas sp.]
MARNKLSETKIQKLTKAGIYSDGDGLYLRVYRHKGKAGETVSRNWVFIFRRGKDRKEIGLGGHGQGTAPVSLAYAREKADEIRERLARGEDLLGKRAEANTFREMMVATIAKAEKSFRNEKHKAQWRMTLDRYAVDLHDRPIAELGVDDVVRVLTPIWDKIPETADRLRQRIAAVFNHAKARKLYVGDNPAEWRGNLEHILPPRQKLSRGHHKALDHTALPAAMAKLRQADAVSARATEFAALTAARSGEVRGATFGEFDLDAGMWIIPAERMKATKEHRVPLTDRAVEIVRAMQQQATTMTVFPISDTAMVKSLRRATGDDSTIHGLRTTFRDWAGDMTQHPREVIEAALAHQLKDKTEAAYRRSDALEKRRVLMGEWAAYCASAK